MKGGSYAKSKWLFWQEHCNLFHVVDDFGRHIFQVAWYYAYGSTTNRGLIATSHWILSHVDDFIETESLAYTKGAQFDDGESSIRRFQSQLVTSLFSIHNSGDGAFSPTTNLQCSYFSQFRKPDSAEPAATLADPVRLETAIATYPWLKCYNWDHLFDGQPFWFSAHHVGLIEALAKTGRIDLTRTRDRKGRTFFDCLVQRATNSSGKSIISSSLVKYKERYTRALEQIHPILMLWPREYLTKFDDLVGIAWPFKCFKVLLLYFDPSELNQLIQPNLKKWLPRLCHLSRQMPTTHGGRASPTFHHDLIAGFLVAISTLYNTHEEMFAAVAEVIELNPKDWAYISMCAPITLGGPQFTCICGKCTGRYIRTRSFLVCKVDG